MFIDEIKVIAKAGHGGKGCVAFHRETFVPKGGPSGGNGGRGGDVILEADHDLNNLIAQFYNPRLIAEAGKAGIGKGMDGHAGKDLILKVPCGTLVWRLPQPEPATETTEGEESETILPSSTRKRPILRHAGSARGLEIEAEEEKPKVVVEGKGELVADLTTHGQRFVLCKGGRGGLGNRKFVRSDWKWKLKRRSRRSSWKAKESWSRI